MVCKFYSIFLILAHVKVKFANTYLVYVDFVKNWLLVTHERLLNLLLRKLKLFKLSHGLYLGWWWFYWVTLERCCKVCQLESRRLVLMNIFHNWGKSFLNLGFLLTKLNERRILMRRLFQFESNLRISVILQFECQLLRRFQLSFVQFIIRRSHIFFVLFSKSFLWFWNFDLFVFNFRDIFIL